jgi:hypothetical protein
MEIVFSVTPECDGGFVAEYLSHAIFAQGDPSPASRLAVRPKPTACPRSGASAAAGRAGRAGNCGVCAEHRLPKRMPLLTELKTNVFGDGGSTNIAPLTGFGQPPQGRPCIPMLLAMPGEIVRSGQFVPPPDATLGGGDGAARRPYH